VTATNLTLPAEIPAVGTISPISVYWDPNSSALTWQMVLRPLLIAASKGRTVRWCIVTHSGGQWPLLLAHVDQFMHEHGLSFDDLPIEIVGPFGPLIGPVGGRSFTFDNSKSAQVQLEELEHAIWGGPTPRFEAVSGIRLNLGCGRDIKEGWVNVDHLSLEGVNLVHDISSLPYPFDSGTVEAIRAKDVLEHLPHFTKDGRQMIIAIMEEWHRILMVGGTVYIHVPNAQFPEAVWVDPTHVRGFTTESFDYFDPTRTYGKVFGFYSHCKFSVVEATASSDRQLTFQLVKLPS
jgi:predicted SAM-dependent methyltransferase